ncbi:MAG: Type 4 prepilin-like protein leader peptide-processing enzyme [candidate division TM6 bacterium GW2011_GWF2_28_16]|nr:MAG: Type 4 prepilin-like protein leader peptide-processing enzyme [candidate division TM6 bacterium GW2011_GWF2_28_16]
MLFVIIFLIIIFLCWGSFLNVVAYRSIFDKNFFQKRSTCNNCNGLIKFYDNIPVISYLILKAKCRQCKAKISVLYPVIEILTSLILTLLFFNIFYINNNFIFYNKNILEFFAYFIFFSALIISTRTDLEALVIPQAFSIYLVPVGFIFAYFNLLKINFWDSIIGAFFGYLILFLTAKIFKFFTKKEGLGEGDMELLALIGAFIGFAGVWYTILIASLTGSLIGVIYLLITKKTRDLQIPFGPFLSFGAIVYFFLNTFIRIF